jgi:hypothetical protein
MIPRCPHAAFRPTRRIPRIRLDHAHDKRLLRAHQQAVPSPGGEGKGEGEPHFAPQTINHRRTELGKAGQSPIFLSGLKRHIASVETPAQTLSDIPHCTRNSRPQMREINHLR